MQSARLRHHSLVTLHLALREKPAYRSAEFDPDIDRAFNIFFGMDDIEQVRSCFEHCAAGKFPHVLMGNGACNSPVDPTYAPTNGHSAFWWPFAPYAVDGEADNWDRHKDYTERVLNGAPGYIAANAIADDLGLKRPWARVPAPGMAAVTPTPAALRCRPIELK
jgi:phytoene dehydrogenase-like protein